VEEELALGQDIIFFMGRMFYFVILGENKFKPQIGIHR